MLASWGSGSGLSRQSMIVVGPLAVVQDGVLSFQIGGVGIEPGVDVVWLDRNNAAVVPSL